MSGHSKWSTIKRKKGAADAKRGKVFSKLSNLITLAARDGGGDLASNFKLRLAVDRAKAENMPKDNIERAIAKGAGGGNDGNLEEILYEAFGPANSTLLIETVTDNKQRTVAEVKNLVEKNGGRFGTPGSVSYLYERQGQVIVKKDGKHFDDLLSLALELGVDDYSEEEDEIVFYCPVKDLQNVRQACEQANLNVISAELVYIPKSEIELGVQDMNKVEEFLEKIDDHDDVQNVYTNASLS